MGRWRWRWGGRFCGFFCCGKGFLGGFGIALGGGGDAAAGTESDLGVGSQAVGVFLSGL